MPTKRNYISRNHFYYLIISLVLLACSKNKGPVSSDPITYNKMYIMPIDTSFLKKRIKLPIDKKSLCYVRLETNPKSLIKNIDQIKIFKSVIYILDKQRKALLLFDTSGKFLKILTFANQQLVGFDIYNDSIFILEKERGYLYKIGLKGNIVWKNIVGFHGVEFKMLSDTNFVLNTAGLQTDDANSTYYQLAIVKITGKLEKMLLPFDTAYARLSYCYHPQFSRFDGKIFFISAFRNIIYEVNDKEILPRSKYDFGKYNLPDKVFLRLKTLDKFSDLPYVTDLSNTFQSEKFSFFTFTMKNETGYLLIEKTSKKITHAGIGVQSDINSDFNFNVPLEIYNGLFFTVLQPQELISNRKHQISFFQRSKNLDLKESDNPIIMFYRYE